VNALNGMPGFPGSRAVSGASYEVLSSLRRPAVISYFKAQGLSLEASIYISKALVNLTRAFSIGTGTEVETSAGRNYFGRSLTIFGAYVNSLRGENNVAPTIIGTKDRVYSLRGEKLAFVPQISAEQKSCLCGEKQALLRQTFIGKGKDNGYSSSIKENKMVLKKMSVFSMVCMLVGMFACSLVGASTLSTNFAEVNVENLKIGGTYNLTETARYPMWVSYSGDVPVDVKFEPVTANADELRKGYEPVPDASWITISKKTVSLLPDETATADVTITVPKDEKYLGKKYQAVLQIPLAPPALPLGVVDHRLRRLLVTALEIIGQPDPPVFSKHERRLHKIVAQDLAAKRLLPGELRQVAVLHERLGADDRVVAPIIAVAPHPRRETGGDDRPGDAGGELLQAGEKRVAVHDHRQARAGELEAFERGFEPIGGELAVLAHFAVRIGAADVVRIHQRQINVHKNVGVFHLKGVEA